MYHQNATSFVLKLNGHHIITHTVPELYRYKGSSFLHILVKMGTILTKNNVSFTCNIIF